MLAAIIQSSDAAIISKTLDGIVTSWNPSAEKLFGYAASEIICRPITCHLGPQPPERNDGDFGIVSVGGTGSSSYETERKRKDGRIVQISLTVSPIHDERGKDRRCLQRSPATSRRAKRRKTQLKVKIGAARRIRPCPGSRPRRWSGHSMEKSCSGVGGSSHSMAGRRMRRSDGSPMNCLRRSFRGPLPEIRAELMETGEWQGDLVARPSGRPTIGRG